MNSSAGGKVTRLRTHADKIVTDAEETVSPPKTESPRDFINRRMRELERIRKLDKAGDDRAPPESDPDR